jgi:hypothetical protein
MGGLSFSPLGVAERFKEAVSKCVDEASEKGTPDDLREYLDQHHNLFLNLIGKLDRVEGTATEYDQAIKGLKYVPTALPRGLEEQPWPCKTLF